MRILIVSTTYLPSTIAVAKLVHDLATEFACSGHDPVILIPDPTINTRYNYTEGDRFSVLRFKSGKIKMVKSIAYALLINETC